MFQMSNQIVVAFLTVSALHVWLDGYPEDWDADNLQSLLAFTSKRLPNTELHLKALTRYTDRFDKYSRVPPPLPWSPDYYEYQEITEQYSGMCLSPAFRGPPSHLLNSYRFPNIPVKHFAEQLTRMDMVRNGISINIHRNYILFE